MSSGRENHRISTIRPRRFTQVALKSTSGRLRLHSRRAHNLPNPAGILNQNPIDSISGNTNSTTTTATISTNTISNIEAFYGFLLLFWTFMKENVNEGQHQNDKEFNNVKLEIANLKSDHDQEIADFKEKLKVQTQMTQRLEQKLRRKEEETNRRNLKMAEFRAFSDRTFANLLPSEIELDLP